MIRARVLGTGKFLPEKVLTNHDLETLCDTTDEWIRKRTGIEERHMAADEDGTSDLAARAARGALEDAGIGPEELDLIVCCTITPDHLLPATACLVQAKLGVTNTPAFDVNAACSGFMYGLATANAYIKSGLYNTVMLIGAEIQTNRITWKNRDTSVLFADGAGAVVLRGEEGERGVLSVYLGADGSNADMLIVPTGGSKDPVTPENVDKDPYAIQMKGAELFKRAVVTFGEAAHRALAEAGFTLDDVALFVPHQANGRIIEMAAQRMGLPPERTFINITKVGNTTAASIPIAIHEARAQGRINDGDLVLLASFGAGVTWASSVVRW